MTIAERLFVARLQRRAATLAPELARRELAAYEVIRRALSEAELAAAIRSGYVDALLADVLSDRNLDEAFLRLRVRIDQAVLEAAGSETKYALPPQIRPDVFNVLNQRVIDAARGLDTRVIAGLKETVREAVRGAVIGGLRDGENPRVIARRLPNVIGLSPTQERAVANFRRELVAGDRDALNRVLGRGTIRTPSGAEITRRAHAGGKGLTKTDLGMLNRKLGAEPLRPDQIARMTDAYRKRLLALNAESNARTVALDAQKAGQRLSWEDAIDRGVVTREQLQRVWTTVGDDRVRPEHMALDGETVGFDERFPNGELEPGESTYNCRCLARVVLKRQRAVA